MTTLSEAGRALQLISDFALKLRSGAISLEDADEFLTPKKAFELECLKIPVLAFVGSHRIEVLPSFEAEARGLVGDVLTPMSSSQQRSRSANEGTTSPICA